MITAMKTKLTYLAAAAIAVSALSGCSSEEPIQTTGEGTVFFSATLNSDVKVRSRATLDELKETARLWISNEKGLVRHYDVLADVPSEGVKLLTGNYVAEAWAGDSVPASFDDRFFKGREEFTIANGDNKSVELVCKIANTVVSVNYEESAKAALHDYKLTVGHSQGSLDFVGDTEDRGYFMMNSRDKDLTWTLTGTLNDGTTYTRTGTIENCKPATLYAMNIKCTEQDIEIGGAYFDVVVDESEIVVEDEITIVSAPVVQGYNFDIEQPVRAKRGSLGRRSLWIKGATQITNLVLSCDKFSSLLGISGNDFDFITMTNTDLKNTIVSKGINYTMNYDDVQDLAAVKVNFEESFTNLLTDGEYDIVVTATDKNGKTGTGTLKFIVSDDAVTTGSVDVTTVWTNRAVITGTVTSAEATNPVLKYRKKGASEWIDAETTLSGNAMSASLTGLEAGTTYEYVAAADGFISSTIGTFTTETAAQLPNSGFEDWYKDGKTWMAFAQGGSMFWDSGNAATKSFSFINANPTYPDESVKHSGTYSVCLHSQNVVVKFAAGNLFVGEFIRTDGTNGVLGWGRPFTSRPSKLRGWVKYSPQSVNHTDSSYPALGSGDTDNGIIYIALLDGSQLLTDSSKQYPVIIKTKEKQLFDKNASNVIAYGELKFTEATAGDGMIQFEIPITYYHNDVKPVYIMCTASASIGGDYFVGGDDSKMWLDDLELVYE